MAITLADFTKIWASTSPLTPYSFSESNYKEGWNFIGGTPPARQMWDSIQKQNDEKMEYIVDNFLPLTGGTMTGEITFNYVTPGGAYNAIKNSSGDKGIVIIGGDTDNFSGATLQLFGQTQASYAGEFYLRASTKSDMSDTSHPAVNLVGSPNGSLTWNGKEVERVNASGSDYIRFESGLQICWGTTASKTTNAGTSTTTSVTFPVAFKDTNYTVTFVDRFGANAWANHTISTNTYSTTDVRLYLQNNADGYYTYTLSWMAVGFWK